MDLLILRLVLSFIIGGTWVTTITLATVRYGARLGGLLAGVPSAVAFSLIFIGWSQSVQSAVEATTALPLAFGSTACFSLVYAFLVKRGGFGAGMVGALAFWALVSFASVEFVLAFDLGFWVSVVGFYAMTFVAYVLLAERRQPVVQVQGARPTLPQWVGRFVLSGGVIVAAVYLSQSFGPVIGGVFSSFPAIISSTLYVVSRVEGVEASRSMAVPVLVATMFAIIPYIVTVRYSFLPLGIVLGTVLGYCVAVPLAYFAHRLVGRRRT